MLCGPNFKNDEIPGVSTMYLHFSIIWNYADTNKVPHLESSRQSGIVEPFISWIFFCKLGSVPSLK